MDHKEPTLEDYEAMKAKNAAQEKEIEELKNAATKEDSKTDSGKPRDLQAEVDAAKKELAELKEQKDKEAKQAEQKYFDERQKLAEKIVGLEKQLGKITDNKMESRMKSLVDYERNALQAMVEDKEDHLKDKMASQQQAMQAPSIQQASQLSQHNQFLLSELNNGNMGNPDDDTAYYVKQAANANTLKANIDACREWNVQ